MAIFPDLGGTSVASFLLNLTGVRLKDSSGNLLVRNFADSDFAEVTTSKANITGNSLVINSDAAGSGNDWLFTIARSGSQTEAITLTLPTTDGSPNQVLQTDGSGVLSWASTGSTTDLVHVDTTTLNFGDSSPKTLFSLPANAVVHKVRVIIDTSFNGTAPTLSIGINGGSNSKYAATSRFNLKGTVADVYEANPGQVAPGAPESLEGYYSADSSSAGSCRIEVHYSIPA